MPKKFFAIFALVALLGSTAACTKKADEAGHTEPAAEAAHDAADDAAAGAEEAAPEAAEMPSGEPAPTEEAPET